MIDIKDFKEFKKAKTNYQLEQISYFATRGSTKGVIKILQQGLNYRLAQLYVEAFHNDKKASDFIFKNSFCDCGNLAIKWSEKPICGNCSLKNSLSKIEYSNK